MGTSEDESGKFYSGDSGLVGWEELVELAENEIHNLVLEGHVHGDVGLFLWS